jgi:hypothetical protein
VSDRDEKYCPTSGVCCRNCRCHFRVGFHTCVQPLNRRKAMGLLLAGAATAHQVQAQVLVPSTAGTANAAGADTKFPRNKIVKIVVAYPTEGTGILGQLIAELLSAQWGSNVMVEYKPGATGIIGTRDSLPTP